MSQFMLFSLLFGGFARSTSDWLCSAFCRSFAYVFSNSHITPRGSIRSTICISNTTTELTAHGHFIWICFNARSYGAVRAYAFPCLRKPLLFSLVCIQAST